MSISNFWDGEHLKDHNLRSSPSSTWTIKSTSRSSSPSSRGGEPVYAKYLDIIHSDSNINNGDDKSEPDRPFDFFDDEEFAFGINLLNNNVACVGDNITKLIQMDYYLTIYCYSITVLNKQLAMPEFQLTDSILTALNAQEPWPDNVRLFQPYEVEQILLPDNASCLAVQAFLKMCNLPFEVEMRWNAEFMSPSGRVPFIKCGAFVVSELEPIVQFAANKGVTLCGKLSAEEKAEMRAYMSLITNVLVNAELYISWIDDETYNAVTRIRNSSVYPWPLGWLQTRAKRNAVAKRLKALHWGDKTIDQVLADVEQCCNSLSQRLGERDYFFGTTPTPMDALVYGHIRALLSATGPKAALFIKPLTTSLLKHVVRVAKASDMKLTPQEDYLLTQAFQFTRSKLSPERTVSERNTRIKRSRLCIRSGSKEDVVPPKDNVFFNKEIIAFKPFASKQVTITTTKDGVTCKYKVNKKSTTTFKIEEKEIYAMAIEYIEDILDKVEEMAFDNLNTKFEESHDFEIVYPQEEKFSNVTVKLNDYMDTNVTVKINEYLDTIEENDVTDTTISLDTGDVLKAEQDTDDDNNLTDAENNDVINDKEVLNYDILDSDGMVNDKQLEEMKSNESGKETFLIDSDIDSSNNKAMKEEILTTSSSRLSKESDKSYEKSDSASADSKSTLKFPSDEEISVESLMKYLREQNDAYDTNFGNYLVVADVD